MAGATVIVVSTGSPQGAAVTQPGIQVYDKAGVRLGSIEQFLVSQPPSRAVNFRGSFTFSVPRVLTDPATGAFFPNPDLEMIPDDEAIKGDRLVVVGDSTRPDDPWGGVMTSIEYTDGAVIVTCADVMDLLSTPQLPVDNDLRATKAVIAPENTPVANLVTLLMSHANTWFGANGEVLWGVDATGTNTFFGYETITGDVESALGTVVERSFGEWAWRIELTATTMTPVLVWRDKFLAGAGPDLVDGPEGNIVASPSLTVDPTTVVNAIRITGSVTEITSRMPPGATALPVAERIPVAEVWLETGGYRRRYQETSATLGLEVPFSFNGQTQDALAAAEEAKRRAMFEAFIHGFHSQFGRPWHDGWSWAGGAGNAEGIVPEDFERLLTADKWVHYRALALEAKTTPAGDITGAEPISIVMMGTSSGTASRTTTTNTKNYTVRRGDTLWAIAARFYGTPYKWPALYALNKAVIDRTARAHGFTSHFSHWIFPGEVLKVPVSPGAVVGSVAKGATGRTDGLWVVVQYDRVNGTQQVWTTPYAVEVPDETVFAFEWRRYTQGNYNPSSDGVGVESVFKTVKGTNLENASWRVVPWGGGGSGATQLAFGITATAIAIPVVSMFDLPTTYPYVVTAGGDEKMLVKAGSAVGAVLTVTRGYEGTTASIHERGETVAYDAGDNQTQTPVPEVPWPEGEAYARKVLERIARPKHLRTVRLANVGGNWSGIQIGSEHAINVQSEGPAGGMLGTVRVLGFAPDFIAGSMELVLEDVW